MKHEFMPKGKSLKIIISRRKISCSDYKTPLLKKKKKKEKEKKSTADALFKVSKIKLRRQLLGELGCQMVL